MTPPEPLKPVFQGHPTDCKHCGFASFVRRTYGYQCVNCGQPWVRSVEIAAWNRRAEDGRE